MAQDFDVSIFSEFREIYSNKTPNEVLYPGGVCIEWARFQCEFEEFLRKQDLIDRVRGFSSICLVSYGDISYPKNRMALEFHLFGINKNGRIPCDRDKDSIPIGYVSLCRSDDWETWKDFVLKLDSLDRIAIVENEIWQEQLEEQYFVSTLRALRKVTSLDKEFVYSGYFGETAEEWMNRTNNLPEDV
ncbi:hypothetical protein ACFL2V_20625 [Pseudomonadota bacterium]